VIAKERLQVRVRVRACVCVCVYGCIDVGMHVRMYVCMYVRAQIEVFAYLSFVDVFLHTPVSRALQII
jgi:hypothetical protein